MGWASGSEVMNEVIEAVKAVMPDEEARRRIYLPIYRVFIDQDWDTVSESLGIDPAFDAIVREDEPGWFEDD